MKTHNSRSGCCGLLYTFTRLFDSGIFIGHPWDENRQFSIYKMPHKRYIPLHLLSSVLISTTCTIP